MILPGISHSKINVDADHRIEIATDKARSLVQSRLRPKLTYPDLGRTCRNLAPNSVSRYLCPAVTPIAGPFEPRNAHHNQRHSAHPKLERGYRLHDQFNHDDDGRKHDHHQPHEVALTLRVRHQFFAFSHGQLPHIDALGLRHAFDLTAPHPYSERLDNAQRHGLCQHLVNLGRTRCYRFRRSGRSPKALHFLGAPMRANIWRSLLSCISKVSPEIVPRPRPPGMPVSGSGWILA